MATHCHLARAACVLCSILGHGVEDAVSHMTMAYMLSNEPMGIALMAAVTLLVLVKAWRTWKQ